MMSSSSNKTRAHKPPLQLPLGQATNLCMLEKDNVYNTYCLRETSAATKLAQVPILAVKWQPEPRVVGHTLTLPQSAMQKKSNLHMHASIRFGQLGPVRNE